MRYILPLLALCLILAPGAALSAQEGNGAVAEPAIEVAASIIPQGYILNKIGGSRIQTTILVSPGASPATYEPTPSQMAALSRAKLYFSIGVPFESSWLPRMLSANPDLTLVPMDKAIAKMEMAAHRHHGEEGEEHEDAGHDHAEHHGHHGIKDPHIWLSPPLMRIMAESVRDALITADPAGESVYRANFATFAREADQLDSDILAIFADVGPGKREFLVFHPAYGYLARAYGLIQTPIEIEGKEPGPRELAQTIKGLQGRKVRYIFASPEFSMRSAKVVADALGAEVAVIDPLAEDWAANLREMARKIKGGLF